MKRCISFLLALFLLLTLSACGLLGGDNWLTLKEEEGSVSLGDSLEKVMKCFPGGESRQNGQTTGYTVGERLLFIFREDEKAGKEKLVYFSTTTGSVNGVAVGDPAWKLMEKTNKKPSDIYPDSGENSTWEDGFSSYLPVYLDQQGKVYVEDFWAMITQLQETDKKIDYTQYYQIRTAPGIDRTSIWKIEVGDIQSFRGE